MPKRIEISHKTIIFTVIFLLFLRFLFQIAEIISWLFISFILMSAFKPMVDGLEKYRIPRVLGIILIYIGLILVIIFAGSTILPPLVNQTLNLAERLPSYLNILLPQADIDPRSFSQQITTLGENIFKVSLGIFNNIVALFTIFVITFYLTLERKNLDAYLQQVLGDGPGETVITVIKKVEERLGAWVRGQLALLLSIGIFTYIGLVLLGIPFALPLAILAGILEIIPNIGPILASLPAIIVSFTVSSLHPVFMIILYFAIQQLENQIVVPIVMSRVVGVPPLVTILAILVGLKIGGIGGAVLAVPIVVTVETVFTQYFRLKGSAAGIT
ncbi:hypothetical protein A3D05_00655 [Candidatus Gottesmanbacteria bacterium RIFCSPHIGHO2_02_FULL_40_24]|uniref:AI-2E family transporter n=1 Tax=Candidatus Gottesmanbacteria bacterium RIFCSPHIGHO2_01_FULL_40_15 TaxID=1798376 RepID=A0A1F5Z6S9_9BACT|nr:MAG: hypothetical protein A2777_01335 [Candidatus Gottesmanbacteria bacterium RIFCSPHIGHO2_01_FULL_40_15]OGG18252.1 MAG: hypothetical protein A3D05_00655 [Candidatus Gottesmanbacteria bacterium RIFCSPHIGHO2_02_FULL_40_24]OGG22918.1 MAG: hypothetical protein A3B48_01220 [Candidatus Gottesmanbacteria bacterium RIFCSPLOWO2_01_FULL_40_10]OGG23536.1 MAG: hypothetical protein A3E42_00735 [Candidatus Gottesmanbacteria bacterium RIFCSPHIGHO2_12_FULL_40_13]OGG31667.1 MAG: hypothetical protein A3I80_0